MSVPYCQHLHFGTLLVCGMPYTEQSRHLSKHVRETHVGARSAFIKQPCFRLAPWPHPNLIAPGLGPLKPISRTYRHTRARAKRLVGGTKPTQSIINSDNYNEIKCQACPTSRFNLTSAGAISIRIYTAQYPRSIWRAQVYCKWDQIGVGSGYQAGAGRIEADFLYSSGPSIVPVARY